jgi:hypothetical protein
MRNFAKIAKQMYSTAVRGRGRARRTNGHRAERVVSLGHVGVVRALLGQSLHTSTS